MKLDNNLHSYIMWLILICTGFFDSIIVSLHHFCSYCKNYSSYLIPSILLPGSHLKLESICSWIQVYFYILYIPDY